MYHLTIRQKLIQFFFKIWRTARRTNDSEIIYADLHNELRSSLARTVACCIVKNLKIAPSYICVHLCERAWSQIIPVRRNTSHLHYVTCCTSTLRIIALVRGVFCTATCCAIFLAVFFLARMRKLVLNVRAHNRQERTQSVSKDRHTSFRQPDLHDFVFCFDFGQNQSKTLFWFCNGILTCQNKKFCFGFCFDKTKTKSCRSAQ